MFIVERRFMAEHYVDNQRFLEEITEYQDIRNTAKDNGEELPPCPEYIGECFMNFTYKDDMISDGIENCVQYMNNFNPEKSKNPFAYFTQIIYYAFVRRIQKEKKQLYIKYKTMDSNASLGGNVEVSQHDQEQNYVFETMTPDQKANMYDFISNFENTKKKKKVVKKQSTIEMFMGA